MPMMEVTLKAIRVRRDNWCVVVLEGTKVGESGEMSAVGDFSQFREGDTLRVDGEWTDHPRFGRQLKASAISPVRQSPRETVMRFFRSGVFPEINETLGGRLWDHFGEDLIRVLSEEPDRVTEVAGIGTIRSQSLKERWDEFRGLLELMLVICPYGVTASQAKDLYDRFEDEGYEEFRKNPYVLYNAGILPGWERVDEIAERVGVEVMDRNRLSSAAAFVFDKRMAKTGSTVFPYDDMMREIYQALLQSRGGGGLDLDDLIEELHTIFEDDGVVTILDGERGDFVVLTEFLEMEQEIAESIRHALDEIPGNVSTVEKGLEEYQEKFHISYDAEQRSAVLNALTRNFSIITGGPGTGKTTILRAITHLSKRPVVLLSPTGKAARRLSEATGAFASTIHSEMQLKPFRGKAVPGFTPRASLVIIDESSMLDISVAWVTITKCLEAGCGVVLVGDVNQLPPVGAGQPFRDILNGSHVIPRVDLQTVYRQGAGSAIITNCNVILRGKTDFEEGEDFLIREGRGDEIASLVLDELIGEGFSLTDVQVMAPQYSGHSGVDVVNNLIHEELRKRTSPNRLLSRDTKVGLREIYRGDRVLCTKNLGGFNLVNGDVGEVSDIEFVDMIVGEELQTVEVLKIDLGGGRSAHLPREHFDALRLAYCMTVHKAQGSQYPVVILSLHSYMSMMLYRSLVYTAVSRAEERCYIIGSRGALQKASMRRGSVERETLLEHLLY